MRARSSTQSLLAPTHTGADENPSAA
ncbi:MAG: hypothetical protein JWQ31_2852, partial [Mycobacterium sp.]|nr:hypothetical protein [Mycobacterium sp.]